MGKLRNFLRECSEYAINFRHLASIFGSNLPMHHVSCHVTLILPSLQTLDPKGPAWADPAKVSHVLTICIWESSMAFNLNVRRVGQAQKDQDRVENLLLSIAPHAVWIRRGNTKENICKTTKFYLRILLTSEMDSWLNSTNTFRPPKLFCA